MLSRIIVAIVVLIVVLSVFRRIKSVMVGQTRKNIAIQTATMRCALCGVYFPSEQAVSSYGHEYCSKEHAREGENR